jgi:hypothetical protein
VGGRAGSREFSKVGGSFWEFWGGGSEYSRVNLRLFLGVEQ